MQYLGSSESRREYQLWIHRREQSAVRHSEAERAVTELSKTFSFVALRSWRV